MASASRCSGYIDSARVFPGLSEDQRSKVPRSAHDEGASARRPDMERRLL